MGAIKENFWKLSKTKRNAIHALERGLKGRLMMSGYEVKGLIMYEWIWNVAFDAEGKSTTTLSQLQKAAIDFYKLSNKGE